MTAHETVPAQSPRQADEAYLAACGALLVALATNSTLTDDEADTLVDAMPDGTMRNRLRYALVAADLLPAGRGLGR